ncbi:hypothetical protein EUGRSUZ_K01789 [Eucalyptus grandis]|uniref:Uncharacterized protein n=2 Tax=Eucalyptus grandis TaxID=71139 RepID=A0ACC3IUC0_EUCGR|nr:hypothetical protein EUGRSUZ_K01789 [Eucalyptus grandis]
MKQAKRLLRVAISDGVLVNQSTANIEMNKGSRGTVLCFSQAEGLSYCSPLLGIWPVLLLVRVLENPRATSLLCFFCSLLELVSEYVGAPGLTLAVLHFVEDSLTSRFLPQVESLVPSGL